MTVTLSTTDSDGTGFTSAPTNIAAVSELSMNALSVELVHALGLLQHYGIIDGYSIRLKREADQDAPGAGP